MTAIGGGSPKQLLDEDIVELLKIGPIGGVDRGTAPHYVSPQNLANAQNFTLNTQYGALSTTLGRVNGLAVNLPGTVTGMFCLSVAGQPNVYIFAVSNPTTGHGELWSSTLGGTPTQLTIPTLPSSGHAWLTTGLQTYFCNLGQWVFLTNGVDTPLKITSSLVVTQWGLIKPAAAPALAAGSAGLLTQNASYYYCVTFATPSQESSQGVISNAIALTTTPSSATFTISGSGVAGDLVGISVFIPFFRFYNAFAPVLTGSTTAAQIAALLAQAISNANPFGTVSASATGAVVTMIESDGGVLHWQNNSTLAGGSSVVFTPGSGTFSGGVIQNSVTLTNIPVSADPQVTERNIYRLGGALGQWRLVTTISDNTTTTYVDGLADSAVTGQSLTIFRDPPPAFAYITVHQNRVFGFGATAVTGSPFLTDSGALLFSNYNEPWGFNSNTGILECNSTTLDDGAVALASLGSVLMCFKKRSTYLMYGSTDLSFQTYFAFPLGCTSARSVTSGFGWTWWESRQGLYYYNGGGFDPVANNISSGRFQQSNIKPFLDGLTAADRAVSCGFVYDSMPHFSFPTKAQTWFFDLRSQQWDSLSMYTSVAWYDMEDQIDVVCMNPTTPGEIDEWFQSGTDLGSAIVSTLTSRTTNCEDSSAIKKAAFVTIEAPISAATSASVVLTLNPGANQTVMPALTFNLGIGQTTHIQDFPLNEWFTLSISVTLMSSVQTHVNSIKINGWKTRQLPDTAIDGEV